MEGRFFYINPKETLQNLECTWHDYLATLPTIPFNQLGHTWTMEKSPAYAQNPFAPLALSSLVPSARLLLVTRNPTQRAYSMFQMYTKHYPDAISAIIGQPRSYFVKNVATGDVRYIGDNFRDLHSEGKKTNRLPPGKGGSFVPSAIAPPSSGNSSNTSLKKEEWCYVSYPPDPMDFDRYVRDAISKYNKKNNIIDNDIGIGTGTGTGTGTSNSTKKKLPREASTSSLPFLREMNGRDMRILTGGLYGPYIEQWLKHFPPQNLVVIPSEDFFAPNEVVRSMTHLQEVLGLPFMDYQTLLKRDPQSGRVEVTGSIGTFLNRQFNSNDAVAIGAGAAGSVEKSSSSPSRMLPQTKDYLDDFYCESNRQLKRLTGDNRYSLTKLDGYSCYNS